MPLRLVPPRTGLSPNWRIRGTYKRISIDQTSGTSIKANAQRELKKIERDIDDGRHVTKGEPTFADAALAYVDATGQERFIGRLNDHFGTRALKSIDGRAIDEAAAALYPDASPATRNRQVHTVVSAILRHAGRVVEITRPKGARGNRRIAYLQPAEAFALLKAASALHQRFGALLTFLLYTGARLGEAVALTWAEVDLDESRALIRQTKTEGARTAFLPAPVTTALAPLAKAEKLRAAKQRGGTDSYVPRSVFGLTKCGRIYTYLEASAKAAGVHIPDRVAFHILRHTWATWMRRYAGMDTAGLVETGAWRSRQSAAVYEHLDATEEGRRAELLPMEPV